ncbi:MAG: hypothetical protein QW424_00720 [Candidatus Bathyarchaeia archaeon]
MLSDRQILVEAEGALNEFYCSVSPVWRLRTCNIYLPRIERIAHEGRLKIIAFSDYRTQKIEELLCLLKNLEEKPDLIIYAGDDVDRFAPLWVEALNFNCGDRELEQIQIKADYMTWSSPRYGFILRLPKASMDESAVKNRIYEMIKFIDALYSRLCESKTLSERDLKELLAGYQSFQLRYRRSGSCGVEIDVVDCDTGTTIMSLREENLRSLVPNLLSSSFLTLYNLIKEGGASSLVIRKVREDSDYAYFHILVGGPERNIFEELASYARYGLAAIIGNDDTGPDRFRIYGRNVYEIHNTWIDMGRILIVGLEGSTCGFGPSGHYSEGSVRLRLELAREFSEGKKLVIVSHSPPRGVLDRAMRFGDEAIGSLALRDFLEEEGNNVVLIICGHVHRCGGMHEKINNATVINVSSHDDPFSKANVAWIVLDQYGGIEEIKWLKIPSLVETIMKESCGEEKLLRLQREARLSRNEAELFIEACRKYGKKLFDDLTELAGIKHRYGFSWSNIFKLYEYGIRAPESITEAAFRRALKESRGIDKVHLKRAYAKVLREREKETVYLINSIPIPDNNQLVIFDTEYSGSIGVLYGFLDAESGELKQFWFDEKPKAQEYLRTKLNKVFIHWGGSDRSLLQQELGCRAPTINLLYFVQTSLVAPISSANLREVHDALCGALEGDFWKRSFYGIDGLDKLILCNRILSEPDNAEAREELAAANKADILALQHVIEKIRQLNSGARLHPYKMEKQGPLQGTTHPIVSQEQLNRIICRFMERIQSLRKSPYNLS